MIADDKDGMALFTFTPEERRYQDARLQPVIADAWAAERGVAWWRAQPEIADAHRQLAPRYRVEGTDAWIAYLKTVLAMTWASTGYFVPIDFWPFILPPVPLDQAGHRNFRDLLNGQRLVTGVFSLDNLRANKQYALLLAHLICCPDPIHTATELPEPAYPWPFVIVLPAGATPRVERQEDIGQQQWKIAERIERGLFKGTKQARVYGASAVAVERQENIDLARREKALKACQLYDEGLQAGKAPGDIIGGIEDSLKISKRGVRNLLREGRAARGEPPPRSGRPPKR